MNFPGSFFENDVDRDKFPGCSTEMIKFARLKFLEVPDVMM